MGEALVTDFLGAGTVLLAVGVGVLFRGEELELSSGAFLVTDFLGAVTDLLAAEGVLFRGEVLVTDFLDAGTVLLAVVVGVFLPVEVFSSLVKF